MTTVTEQQKVLRVEDLHVSVGEKRILNGVSLEVKPGEVHAILGPNGSGKSTLSFVLAGHPKYKVEAGRVTFGEKDLFMLTPGERSKAGMFLAFQYPTEIQGLSFVHFLYTSMKAREPELTPQEFTKRLKEALELLQKDKAFTSREVNVGFSGGEKKRGEVLQLLLLRPTLAILDETDSGLDVDALGVVVNAIKRLRGPRFSAVVITHYPKMLELLNPDKVHVMVEGRIVATGGHEVMRKVEDEGYGWLEK